ncbi:MAG: hypothetical protein HYZ54_03380 [Ignavibacteriae bacterium]|nr:hypothetical protein [Ignavibacteriota bacterium]
MRCKVYAHLSVLLLVCYSFLGTGCGHLNKLSSVKFRNSSVYSDYQLSADAARGIVCLGYISAKPIVKDSSHTFGQIINTIGTIGSTIATSSVESKIARSVSPDSLAWSVASGFEQILERYASVRPVNSIQANPEFIVETLLEHYELSSTQFGVYANVEVTSRIIERSTGKKVWGNSESKTIELSNISPAGVFSPISRSVSGIVNMVQILSMSDEEVKGVLLAAAAEAGRKMGETFREDISGE